MEGMAKDNPVFDGGYFRFPGGTPDTVEKAEEILRGFGYVRSSPEFVAEAILDDEVEERIPAAETIVQVFFVKAVPFASAYRVHPLRAERDKADFVKQTFAGGERSDDFFMIKEKDLE